jgi:hypothetical protein
MDLKKIGIVLIIAGIALSIFFINEPKIFVPALTVTVLGFFMAVVGYISEIRKRKIINDQLDVDIVEIIQPMITKYSNLNKELHSKYSGEEYVKKRIQLNRDLESELAEKIPYLESREIKKIVIEFSKEQDKMQ